MARDSTWNEILKCLTISACVWCFLQVSLIFSIYPKEGGILPITAMIFALASIFLGAMAIFFAKDYFTR